MTNLNLLFNKTYYSELGKGEPDFSRSLQRYNKQIFNTVFDHSRDYCPSPIASEKVLLKTVYPGLLIGSGNPHGSNKSNDDIRLGFSFDYVSGQPYIPGSSVKGVLRSKFKQCPEAIAEILKMDLEADVKTAINSLETDIFDGKDVFLDAVVYDGEPVDGRLMGPDYVAPHSSPVKSPIPVLFIKILPEVKFEFRFKLYDSEVGNVKITAGKKKQLFKELLILFGAGAKTNVGYGVFAECDNTVPDKTPIHTAVESTPQRNHSNATNTVKSEFKRCKGCGSPIYKYRKNGSPNYFWKDDLCKDCKFKQTERL